LFSDRALAAVPLMASGQRIVRDEELPGFFVLVGKTTKTFMVQGDLRADGKRQTIRVKVGEVGRLQTREARAKAKRILGSIIDGVDPRPAPRKPKAAAAPSSDPTLREAWTTYRDSHMRRKRRSEGTVASYTDHFERLLKDWLDEPLSKFGHEPGLLKQRHDQLTLDNGPYIANGAMRSFRAIYNHARKSARSLPAENPVLAVDWNPEKRRDTGMGVADLAGWWKELQALDNPLRREFHLFLLLSGSRPDPIKRARLEHADLRRRILHIPKPKGGEDRAFDIPLSREMVRCLIRAMRLGRAMYPEQAQTWLFPADSKPGHLIEHKEDRRDLSKWGGDLRQTYRTLGQAAGVSEVDMHLLMNHSLPNVNVGYITRHKLLLDHLRKQQQAVSSLAAKGFGRAARSVLGGSRVRDAACNAKTPDAP
jgi:integrase